MAARECSGARSCAVTSPPLLADLQAEISTQVGLSAGASLRAVKIRSGVPGDDDGNDWVESGTRPMWLCWIQESAELNPGQDRGDHPCHPGGGGEG